MSGTFGVILAGGLGRRMNGADKALLTVAGKSVLARLAERLAPQCAGLVINANGDPARFQPFGLPVVADPIPGFAGPLAGVLAGLDHVAATRPDVDLAMTVPADTPFAPRDLVSGLRAARDHGHADIAVARSGGRTHHAIALWPVSLREALRKALIEEDLRKVSAFIAGFSNVTAEWPVTPYDPFFNINRPEDLPLADAIAAGSE